MSRKPLLIVEEYLQSSEAEIRLRAARALSVLEDSDSIRRLVEVAIDDRDAKVRREATRLVEDLPGDFGETARQELHDVLKRQAQDRHEGFTPRHYRANLLLSRMHPGRETTELVLHDLGQRVELASGVRDYQSRDPAADTRSRAAWAAVQGGLLAALLFALGTMTLDDSVSENVWLVVCGVALVPGVLMALNVSWKASAIGHHTDRLAGWIAELRGSASESLVGVTAVTLLTMLAWPQVAQVSVYRIGLLGLGSILAGTLFVAAIRLATASAFRGWARSEWLAQPLGSWCVRWTAALTGWFFGGAFLTAGSVFIGLLPVSLADSDTLMFVSGLWFSFVPMGLAVAAALSRVESCAVKSRLFERGTSARVASVLLFAAFLAGYLRIYTDRSKDDLDTTLLKPIAESKHWLDRVPDARRFRVGFEQKVRLELEVKDLDNANQVALRLMRGNTEISRDSTPPMIIEVPLERGSYQADIVWNEETSGGPYPVGGGRRFSGALRFEYFTTALKWVRRITDLRAFQLEDYELSVTLHADPVYVFDRQILEYLEYDQVEEALRLYSDLFAKRPGLERPTGTLGLLCRIGSLHHLHKTVSATTGFDSNQGNKESLATVCEDAMNVSGEDPGVHFGHGLSRLLTEGPDEVQAELRAAAFRISLTDTSAGQRRLQWIDRLRAELAHEIDVGEVEDELTKLRQALGEHVEAAANAGPDFSGLEGGGEG